jgi:hypothetical protein
VTGAGGCTEVERDDAGGHEIDLVLREGVRFAIGRFGVEHSGLKKRSLDFARDDRVGRGV